MNSSLTQHEALIHVMVMMSAVDRTMTDGEMERIGRLSRFLPVFEGFDDEELVRIARDCAQVLSGPDASPDTPAVGWEETGWAASHTAREALAVALTGMIDDGEITRTQALELARMVLRENAKKLYGFQ